MTIVNEDINMTNKQKFIIFPSRSGPLRMSSSIYILFVGLRVYRGKRETPDRKGILSCANVTQYVYSPIRTS